MIEDGVVSDEVTKVDVGSTERIEDGLEALLADDLSQAPWPRTSLTLERANKQRKSLLDICSGDIVPIRVAAALLFRSRWLSWQFSASLL